MGGVPGALLRDAVPVAMPHAADGWPWSTLVVNVSGCLLIGVLMVLVTERFHAHPLARPLLGVGVLGGYTTFSTYAVDAVVAAASGGIGVAVGSIVATPLLALLAVTVGAVTTRALVPGR